MLEIIKDYWPVIGGFVSMTVWLIRQEGKTLNCERRLDHLEMQVDNLQSALVKELNEVKTALARIEGILQGHREARRTDD